MEDNYLQYVIIVNIKYYNTQENDAVFINLKNITKIFILTTPSCFFIQWPKVKNRKS